MNASADATADHPSDHLIKATKPCVVAHQEQLNDSKKLLTQLLAEQRHSELR